YTIRGVQRILREQGPKFVQAVWQPGAAQPGRAGEGDEEEREHSAEPARLPPDAAARALFGLLRAPDAPGHDPSNHEDEASDDGEGDDAENRASRAPRSERAQAAEPRLTLERVRRLQSALHELQECRRLI